MVKIRLPFVLLAFVNLVAGMLSGLIRIGWNIPLGTIAVHHGAIMVGGFLTTLIILEKVIPLKKKGLFVLPVINALSLLMVVPGFYKIGLCFLLAGAVGLVGIFLFYLKKQPYDRALTIMVIGAFCLVVGHIMLLTKQFYPVAFPWWMGFILFVIVGERVELSKFLPVTEKSKRLLSFLLGLYLIGVILPFHVVGKYLAGSALICVAIWLLRKDVVSIGLKKHGLIRFSALSLLFGYIALLFNGVFLITLPDLPLAYDITVHTFFIGFAFSMIFAHGPIILPGVIGLSIKPYHRILYLPLTGLHLSLIFRVLADLSIVSYTVRPISGWISAGAILLYFILLMSITVAKTRHAKAV